MHLEPWFDLPVAQSPTTVLTVLEFLPTAFAFQALKVPEGSVWYRAGLPSGLKPTISVEMPKGRTPPLCVYFCCTPGAS